MGTPAQAQRVSAVGALLAAAAASAAVHLGGGQGAGLAASPAVQDITPEEPDAGSARSSVSGAHSLGRVVHGHSSSLPPSPAQHIGTRSSAMGKGASPLPPVAEQAPQSLPAVMQPLPLSNVQGRGSSISRSPEQGQPADQQQPHRRPSMLRASLLRLAHGAGQRASLPGALHSQGSLQHAGLPVDQFSLDSSGSPCQPHRESHAEPASGSTQTQAWQPPQPAPASEGQLGAPGSASQRPAEDPASCLAAHLPGEQTQAPADQKWIEQQLALLEVLDPALPAQQELHVGRLAARLSAGARSSAAGQAILQESEAQAHSPAGDQPGGDAPAAPDGSVMPHKAAGEQQMDPELQQQLLWLQMMMQQGEGLSEEEQTSLQQLWLTQQLQQAGPSALSVPVCT